MQSTNRVLCHLQPTCQCQRVKRQLREVHETCEAVEQASGKTILFWGPDAAAVMESGDLVEIGLLTEIKMEPCIISDDIPLHTIGELRQVADKLNEAADRIEREFGSEVQS